MGKWYIDDEGARKLDAMWRWMRNLRVTGAATCKNTEDGATIFVHPARVVPQEAPAAATLPAGQYDGMVLQTTSQLTLGAGYLRIVNTPPT